MLGCVEGSGSSAVGAAQELRGPRTLGLAEWLRTKEPKGNHRNAVLPTVGIRACVHHNCIEKLVSELALESGEMRNMVSANRATKLRFHGHDLAPWPNHYEVHLVVAAPSAQVSQRYAVRVAEDRQAQGHQRLEQRPQICPIRWLSLGALSP